MLQIILFLFCQPTIRFAKLLEFETISSCWTWYGIDFFCIFNFSEQWESSCYQTLKQYQVAGLGMLLMSLFLFYQPTIRVAALLEIKTISSCWTWYGTDISFPFLSPHYQIRHVIKIGNNIKLLDLICDWFFPAFLTSPNKEIRLDIRH